MTNGPQITVWPCLRYDDAPGALRFLVDVFGFTERLVVPAEDGDISHAELGWPEGGAVMFGTTRHKRGTAHDVMRSGVTTVYVVTDHVDEVHQRAVASGADIATELHDTDFGSHTFTARDPEGNLWTFGTYRGA
ncbi:VOC family protein [Haloechinothrix sp. YIM 98757]|uniref:VOC family protein n=1 Tax=Haloechinothrix aidingensis TaxID=2752311 RepID=A0A838AGK5_9PSEU|nr:VOC family protein [Haloechinothrix aidingensis]MBA0128218.1 VOC family protein [Haloechinothrix aidingensis]